jgi:hypothetical protein
VVVVVVASVVVVVDLVKVFNVVAGTEVDFGFENVGNAVICAVECVSPFNVAWTMLVRVVKIIVSMPPHRVLKSEQHLPRSTQLLSQKQSGSAKPSFGSYAGSSHRFWQAKRPGVTSATKCRLANAVKTTVRIIVASSENVAGCQLKQNFVR